MIRRSVVKIDKRIMEGLVYVLIPIIYVGSIEFLKHLYGTNKTLFHLAFTALTFGLLVLLAKEVGK